MFIHNIVVPVVREVFVKPNEQWHTCLDIAMARIGNRKYGAFSKVERQYELF
ncbi:hypothetical protein HMPREF6745_2130 [Prevotella sp. oral taxon 472 str. F0295]|nr:hypothetical protein HMPREF6745_2130 [Prevotella sp. oral taxon 472 str. F0295]